MSWTDKRVDLLKKLWTDGLSASQIAAELGGITRNAVIGKVHRLGLSGRAKTAAPVTKQRRPRSATAPVTAAAAPQQTTVQATSTIRTPSAGTPQLRGATALKMAPQEDVAIDVEAAPLAELVPFTERATILTLTERTCKWPIGDPSSADFYFCGRHSEPGVPYCPQHCRIAYQPVNDRRRAAPDKKALRG